MECIGEIEDATRLQQLTSSASLTWENLLGFEILDSHIARGLRTTVTGNFERQVASEKGRGEQQGSFSTWRQIAWMTYKNFKVTRERDAILEFGELMKVQL